MLPDMLQRTRTIYKGDVMAGSFYMFIGMLSAISALILHLYSTRLGLYYLSIGLAVFSAYMIGKGSIMIYMYYSRYKFYKSAGNMTAEYIQDEKEYTKFRIRKKQRSRRVYMYIILIGSFVAFAGLFHIEKGLILGTCIPIVLLSGIEFCVGLLTEFRLFEFIKQLRR